MLDRPPGGAASHRSACLGLGTIQGASEILNQVGRILDAYREPEQAVGNAGLAACVRVHRDMRHGRRMGHQRFHSAQRLGEDEEPERAGHRLHRGNATSQLEAHDGAEATLLAGSDLVAGVGLWLAAPWGAVVWLTAVISMAAVEVLFPQIYGGSLWVVGLQLMMLGVYLWLALMAAREQPG